MGWVRGVVNNSESGVLSMPRANGDPAEILLGRFRPTEKQVPTSAPGTFWLDWWSHFPEIKLNNGNYLRGIRMRIWDYWEMEMRKNGN